MSAEPAVSAGAPTFGYWAPELRELHLRIPLQARPIGGEELFRPAGVTVNGERVAYSYWYFNGVTHDYIDMPHASRDKIEVFAAYPWKGGQECAIKLAYNYGGQDGEIAITAKAPQGGLWTESDGGNYGFQVREEAGLARTNEPVEFDITLPAARFANPGDSIRATVMPRPGVFEEIPCQIYVVSPSLGEVNKGEAASIRFRAVVQLSLAPRAQTTVFLWHSSKVRDRERFATGVRVEGGAIGGTVETARFKIKLDDKSGQLYTWEDKNLKVLFDCWEPGAKPPALRAMHYTPDVFRPGVAWSHADDWQQPESQEVRGPLFYETMRRGPMPGAPEIESRATYRFYANRPEVRSSSVMRVIKDVDIKAFRNGGMIQRAGRFTHAAWPRQDGSVVRVPVSALGGNDTGAPPVGRMPWNTPWVVFYNQQSKIGIAVITANQSYFEVGGGQPNRSNGMYYVSLYRDKYLYTLRALNINYSANIRTQISAMNAGTTAYEEMAFLPFTFSSEDKRQFDPVETLHRELLNPLVIVP